MPENLPPSEKEENGWKFGRFWMVDFGIFGLQILVKLGLQIC